MPVFSLLALLQPNSRHVADSLLREVVAGSPEIAELVRSQSALRRVNLQALLSRPLVFLAWWLLCSSVCNGRLPGMVDKIASLTPKGHDDHYSMQASASPSCRQSGLNRRPLTSRKLRACSAR